MGIMDFLSLILDSSGAREKAEKINGLQTEIKEQRDKIDKLASDVDRLESEIRALRERLMKEEEKENLLHSVPEKKNTENQEENIIYWTDLNRGPLFINLYRERTAKSAFEVKGSAKKKEFRLCSLDRVRAYDEILYAIEIHGVESTLTNAADFRTVENGEAVLADNGYWRIVKRTVISLVKRVDAN